MYAISLVLATFMAGLALGSYLVAGVLKRYPQPLKAYAIMELGIGLWAFLVPFLLKGVDHLYVSLFPDPGSSLLLSSLLRFVLSSLVLLVPTVLMGGTLPALTTYLTPQLQQLGKNLSSLYALNTLGAVAGTWWVGFYALPWLGVNLTNILAVVINLAIGVSFLLIKHPAESLIPEVRSNRDLSNTKIVSFLLGGILVAGFAAMVYEVAWTRTLIMVLGSSTYAFSCILMAFLLGIALGSFVFNQLRGKITFGLSGFCLIEILIGTFSLVSLPAFSYLPRLYLILYHLLPSNTWALQGLRFFIPVAIMIIPAALMGFAFPLAGELYAQETGKITSGVGNIYGANTLGNVCGALFTGFLLLSGLGAQSSLKLAIILNLSVGAAGILIKRSRFTAFLVGVSLLVGCLTFFQPKWNKYLLNSGVSIYSNGFDPLQSSEKWLHQYEMLFYKEGLNSVVGVYQQADGGRFLRINGKADASNLEKDMPSQLLFGYAPVFLHPNAQNALVIGLGSGITTRAVAQFDFIRQVDCVEIEPRIVEAAKFFNKENRNIYQNPKVKIIIEDGRNYLKRPDQSYDLITSEPSNPWMKGIGNLFSTDFYQLCRRRLKANGIMCQWIHSYSISPKVFKMEVNSFRQSFPYCQLWYIPQGADVLMIGSEQPVTFDLARIGQLVNYNPDIKEELRNVLAIDSPINLSSYFMLNNDEITEFAKGSPLNTDNYPRLEFLAPYDLLSNSFSGHLNYKIIRNYKGHILPKHVRPKDMHISLAEYYYGLSRVFLSGKNVPEAYRFIKEAIKIDDQDSRFFLVRGRIFAGNKDFTTATADFKRSKELDPNNYEPYLELAHILESQNRAKEAQEYYLRARKLAPNNPKLLLSYAYFLSSQGEYDRALSMTLGLTSSSEVKKYMVWELIGDIYSYLKDFEKTRMAYEESLNQNPTN